MIVDSFNWDLRDLVNDTERRLPADIRQALAHVRVYAGPASMKVIADCGPADIRVRLPLPPWSAAARAVLIHECAHIYLAHAQALRSGTKSAAECEAEAEQLLQSWGFEQDLRARAYFYGR